MFLKVIHVNLRFRHCPTPDRNAGFVNGFGTAGDKVVPGMKLLAFLPQPVGAGGRHPIDDSVDVVGIEDDAVGNDLRARLVVAAAAEFKVEQPAGDVGELDILRAVLLELEQAAKATAVAQGLPLAAVQVLERETFPETVPKRTLATAAKKLQQAMHALRGLRVIGCNRVPSAG